MASDRDADQLNRRSGSGNGDSLDPFAESLHDAVGAYVLDALTEPERRDFAAHLATCAACQRDVAELTQVVELLPWADERELTNATVAPSSNLRQRLIDAALADDAIDSGQQEPPRRTDLSETVEPGIEPQAPIPFPPPHTQRRHPNGSTRSQPASLSDSMGRLHRSWLVAAVLAIVAGGAVVWGVIARGDVQDRDQQIAALQGELDAARQRANASAWHLGGSAETAGDHSGTLLYGLQDQTVVLVVRNMPELPQGKVYQTWLIRGSTPEPASTFTVDQSGTGMALVDPNAPTYDVVAITEEPSGGSDAPTSPVLLQGALSGAAGAVPGSDFAGLPLLSGATVQLTPPDDAS